MKDHYSPIRAGLVCLVWAFLLFLPAAADFTTSHNRYVMHWSATHLWVYLALVVGLGVLLFAADQALHRWWPAAYAPAAALFAFVSVLFLVCYFAMLWVASLTTFDLSPFGVILGLVALLVLVRRGYLEKFRAGLTRAALFMTFMVPIFFLTAFSYPTYAEPDYPPPDQVPDRAPPGPLYPADNVYILSFDGWSYRLTFEDGKPNAACPNLRDLAEGMCVFTRGHSPGCYTNFSVPRLLFERSDMFCLRDGEPGFWKDEAFHPARQEPGLFSKAHERGFRTYMVGWHHNYHAMLDGRVDYLYQLCLTGRVDRSPLGIAADLSWGLPRLGPVLGQPIYCSPQIKQNTYYHWQNEALMDRTAAVLPDPRPKGQFLVTHLPLPHFPFIYDAEGGLRDMDDFYPETEDLCKDHIAYLDRVIGRFMDSLKKQGKYENAVVVLTSDHTWRIDPQAAKTGHSQTHVPVLIHFPGQKHYVRVDEPFTTFNVMRLLDHVHAHGGRPDNLDQTIRDNCWFSPVPDEELEWLQLLSK